jgi:hypothetical protein
LARLILGLFVASICCAGFAASVFPNGNSWQGPYLQQQPTQSGSSKRLDRLAQLLENPQPSQTSWRIQLWQQLKRLEHGHSELVLRGWSALAESGQDGDLANLLIYQRRHSVPLAPVSATEGAEATLERCLHLWGSGKIPATREALTSAIQRFPQDKRFVRNLQWLEMEPPAKISWQESPREFALAVLAARQPHL